MKNFYFGKNLLVAEFGHGAIGVGSKDNALMFTQLQEPLPMGRIPYEKRVEMLPSLRKQNPFRVAFRFGTIEALDVVIQAAIELRDEMNERAKNGVKRRLAELLYRKEQEEK